MPNTCLYCQSPFVAERNTKRYCSDNCRQLAYLSRKGQTSGLSLGKMKDTDSVSVKSQVDKMLYVNSVINDELENDDKNSTKDTALYGTGSFRILNDRIKSLEATIAQQNNLILTMWTNIKASIESSELKMINELRKELSRQNPLWRGLNGLNYCKPCEADSFMSRANVKRNELENRKQAQAVDNENAILQDAIERIKQLEARLAQNVVEKPEEFSIEKESDNTIKQEPSDVLNEKNREQKTQVQTVELSMGITDAQTKVVALHDKPYEWINPRLHILIQKHLDKGDGGYKFKNALRYWSLEETKDILWVNVRLRCLLDNLVRLTLRSHTNYETLAALTNAFVDLLNSESYTKLPASYPYKNLIAEQADVLRGLIIKSRSERRTREKLYLWLSVKQKALLIATCTELAACTEKVSFNDLSFKPVNLKSSFIDKAK